MQQDMMSTILSGIFLFAMAGVAENKRKSEVVHKCVHL